jgi:hypothetical protein
MKLWSLFATLAVSSALLASPALGIAPSTNSDASVDRPEVTPGGTSRVPDTAGTPGAAIDGPKSGTLEGRIAALERESGRFVLDTDYGAISLVTSPDELTGVDVGDFVQVSLVSDQD